MVQPGIKERVHRGEQSRPAVPFPANSHFFSRHDYALLLSAVLSQYCLASLDLLFHSKNPVSGAWKIGLSQQSILGLSLISVSHFLLAHCIPICELGRSIILSVWHNSNPPSRRVLSSEVPYLKALIAIWSLSSSGRPNDNTGGHWQASRGQGKNWKGPPKS